MKVIGYVDPNNPTIYVIKYIDYRVNKSFIGILPSIDKLKFRFDKHTFGLEQLKEEVKKLYGK